MTGRRRLAGAGAVAVLVLVGVTPLRAEDEAKPPDKFEGGVLSLAQTLIKKGEDRTAIFGARALGRYKDGRWRVTGRADASATQDGAVAEAPKPDFADLTSFSALEAYGALGYEVYAGFEVTAIYGIAIELDAGKPKILERYPQTVAFGVARAFNVGSKGERGFALVTFGRHDAGGGSHYDKLILTAQVPLLKGIYAVADAVINLGTRGASFSRSGVAYRF